MSHSNHCKWNMLFCTCYHDNFLFIKLIINYQILVFAVEYPVEMVIKKLSEITSSFSKVLLSNALPMRAKVLLSTVWVWLVLYGRQEMQTHPWHDDKPWENTAVVAAINVSDTQAAVVPARGLAGY